MIEYNSLRIAINLITVFITFKVAEFVKFIVISWYKKNNLQYGAKIQSGCGCICTICNRKASFKMINFWSKRSAFVLKMYFV